MPPMIREVLDSMKLDMGKDFFSNFNKIEKNKKVNRDFEYVAIDNDSKETLEKIYAKRERWGKAPDKWCINAEKTIAFIQLDSVPSAIVRGPKDESYESDLFIWNGGYGIISVYCEYSDPEHMVHEDIQFHDANNKINIPDEELKNLLKSSMRMYESWGIIDYHIKQKMKEIEKLKNMPFRILHGEFSQELKEILDSVNEVEDVEMKFRRMCFEYYANRQYNGPLYWDNIYLDNNKYAFYLFDSIIWLYLHKDNSLERFKSNWPKISNKELVSEIKYSKESWKHFYIAMKENSFLEDYFETRTTEGKIVIKDDSISLTDDFNEYMLKKIQRFA